MTSKEKREKRIAAGLCPKCGGVLDTDGKSCSKCHERDKREYKERREWYLKRGICPYCGSEKLFGTEKLCLECKVKQEEKNRKYYENMTTEEKERYLEKKNENARKRYQKKKENGICVKCGKRRAAEGKAHCEICLVKKRNRARQLYQEKYDIIPRVDRVAYELCYICGSPIDGDYRVCRNCHERLAENILQIRQRKTERSKHPWREDNELLYISGGMRKYCEADKREGVVK